MQGMMIQDYTPSPKAKAPVAGTETRAAAEKPFGAVLGGEEEKVVAPSDEQTSEPAGREDAVSIRTSEVTEQDEESAESETPTAPFFMAALIDRSAPFVEPSENTELVGAAERTQELIGAWLQPGEEGESSLTDVLTTALKVLDRAAAEKAPVAADVEQEQLTLSDEEIAELKGLMAVMLQSGQVPEAFEGNPLVPELKKQIAQVQSARVDPAVQTAQTAQTLASEGGPPEVQAGLGAADPQGGLQENRLAGLLKPRREQPTLHEARADKASADQGPLPFAAGQPEEPVFAPAAEVASTHDIALETPEIDLKSLAAKLQVPAGLQPATAGPPQGSPMNTLAPKMMQLPSGMQLAESQLVDQVVTHIAGSADGESGRMRLRLHPAELGSIRLDLMVEGDRLRAHLQAQTHQVQEVLERHLPQLRDTLQQQGLKIDDFRVDVQTGQDQSGDQGYAWQQGQQQGSSAQSPWFENDWSQQDVEIPLQQLVQGTDGGISLRV